jgi:hypothetical protein
MSNSVRRWGPVGIWPLTSLQVDAPSKDEKVIMYGVLPNGRSSTGFADEYEPVVTLSL